MSKLSAIILSGCLALAMAGVSAAEGSADELQPANAMEHDAMAMSDAGQDAGGTAAPADEASPHEGMAAEDKTESFTSQSHDGMANEDRATDEMKKDDSDQ